MSKYSLGWRAIKHAETVKRKKAKVGIMKRIFITLFKKQKKTSLMGVREVRSWRVAHA